MSLIIEGTLEIYPNRGVIYFHSQHTMIPTLLRIQGLPTPIPASQRHRNIVRELLDIHAGNCHTSWQGERVPDFERTIESLGALKHSSPDTNFQLHVQQMIEDLREYQQGRIPLRVFGNLQPSA